MTIRPNSGYAPVNGIELYYEIHGSGKPMVLLHGGFGAIEMFGPVLAVTTFKDDAEALEIANDTLYGLGAGVWTRNGNRAYTMGRKIKAGRVWTNCYHQYPAGAAFGGYKISGVGRENHRMMLDHYSQTKNLLVSYSTKPLGLF